MTLSSATLSLLPSASSSPSLINTLPHKLPLPSSCRWKPSLCVAAVSSQIRTPARSIVCAVAVKSDADAVPSSTGGLEGLSAEEEAELKEKASKEGARVRVKVPLKVYHVPKAPEVDLTGMEGVVKQFVGLWKGKRISANFPFKVEFQINIEGRGLVKFVAHLKEDEIEFI